MAVLAAISIDLGLPGQALLGSLRFHIGAAMVLLSLVMAVAGARLRALAMLGLIGLSLVQGASMVMTQQQRRDGLEAASPVASLRALSFNVLTGNPRAADAAAYIAASDADVVLVLEAPGIQGNLPALKSQYPYQIGCADRENCDMVLMSRTPILSPRQYEVWPMKRRRLTLGIVEINGQQVTLVAMHLTKPYFDNMAALELQQARQIIAGIEGPVLLMGDFNAAAWSSAVATLADDLDLVPPPYYPATWPVRLGPLGVPIDNMFTRGAALIRDIAPTPSSFGSNHLGLVAQVDLF